MLRRDNEEVVQGVMWSLGQLNPKEDIFSDELTLVSRTFSQTIDRCQFITCLISQITVTYISLYCENIDDP
jgi:hypothetical protein